MTRNKKKLFIITILCFLCQFVCTQGALYDASNQVKDDSKKPSSQSAKTAVVDEDDAEAAEKKADETADLINITDSLETDTLSEDTIIDLPWPQSMQVGIDNLIEKTSILRTSVVGILVYDLTADSVIYEHYPKLTLRPASTMKVLTAVTALDKLGANYKLNTRLSYTGSITDSTGVLKGDIYLTGALDPKINRQDLRELIVAMRDLGIDTIRGNVYADRSMKDKDLLGSGWCWDDNNPEISALVYNRKDRLINRFVELLAAYGICFEGQQSDKTCPKEAKEIITITHTVADILPRMMKNSDNLYAESMFYHVGLTQGKPATARKAANVIETILRKVGLQSAPHRLADGSGLSLYNYVSAEIEVAFLKYAYQNKQIYNNLYPALPIAGVDGTLSSRMGGTKTKGNVHAKTGTVAGVSALAGYCTASNGHVLCFSIMNQGALSPGPMRSFQDKVCAIMCK